MAFFLAVTLFMLWSSSHAEVTATPTFNIVGTTTIMPPYGVGSATYYASEVGKDRNGTTYAMTCVPHSPQTAVPTLSIDPDPCQTVIYGTEAVLFYQGRKNWRIIRNAEQKSSTTSSARITTTCTAIPKPTHSCGALPTPMECVIYPTADAITAPKKNLCDMGLKQQQVLMVQMLPTPITTTATTRRASPTDADVMTDGYSFTDLGRTPAAAPVETITFYKQSGGAGKKSEEVGRGLVGLAVAGGVMLAVV